MNMILAPEFDNVESEHPYIELVIKPEYINELEKILRPKSSDDPSVWPVVFFRATERHYRIFQRLIKFIASNPTCVEILETPTYRQKNKDRRKKITGFLAANQEFPKHYSATFDLSSVEMVEILASPIYVKKAGRLFKNPEQIKNLQRILSKYCHHVNINLVNGETQKPDEYEYKQIDHPSSVKHVIAFGLRPIINSPI